MGEAAEAAVIDASPAIETADATRVAAAAPVRIGLLRWVTIAVLLLAVMSAFFDRINIAVLFTNASFKDTIGIGNNPALLGLLMTVFVFAYGASAICLSGCADLFGPRRALSAITLILSLAMALMGASSSYATMLVGRIVLGVAEGPQFGTANLLVARWFPPGRRGLGTSLWTIGSPLGSAVGFPLIIFLVAHYGWRGSFFALAALNGLIVLPTIWLLLRDRPPGGRSRPVVTVPAQRWAPMLRRLFGDWQFWMLTVFDCGAMIYLWGLNSWLPAYLRQARGFDLLHAGFYSSLPFILMIGGQITGAAIGDRWRSKAAICFGGLLLTGVSVYLASIVPGAAAAAWCLALSAGFWGMTVPTLFAMGSEIIPAELTATGFGIYAGIANLVGAAAPFVMGTLIGRSGNFEAGLLVIVLSCIVLSASMLPMLRRY
jgi:sugar phosphate permease